MNREQAHIECLDGGVLEVRWHPGEVALVSGNTKVRLSTEAAANLVNILVDQSTPQRGEISPLSPSHIRKRKAGPLTPQVLDYIISNRPHLRWDDIAIQLDRKGIKTIRGKGWTGHNLKCAFERHVAATSSRYGHLF